MNKPKPPPSSKAEMISAAGIALGAVQLKKIKGGLDDVNLNLKTLTNAQNEANRLSEFQIELDSERNMIARATQNEIIQIKEIGSEALKVALASKKEVEKGNVKLDAQIVLQQIDLEEKRLSREEEKNEKMIEKAQREYIQSQINLAFEIRMTSEEVHEGKNTILEKYYLLGFAEDLLELLDTEKFGISEKEYAYQALKDTKKRRDEAKSKFTKQDDDDLKTIYNIEAEDESIELEDLFSKFKKLIQTKQELTNTVSSASSIDFAKDDLETVHKSLSTAVGDLKNILNEFKK